MKDFISNVLVAGGCALIIYAASRVSPTLAYLVGGILALVAGVNLTRLRK